MYTNSYYFNNYEPELFRIITQYKAVLVLLNDVNSGVLNITFCAGSGPYLKHF